MAPPYIRNNRAYYRQFAQRGSGLCAVTECALGGILAGLGDTSPDPGSNAKPAQRTVGPTGGLSQLTSMAGQQALMICRLDFFVGPTPRGHEGRDIKLPTSIQSHPPSLRYERFYSLKNAATQ